jgi:DNA mismatch endonuclease (patch repair protein)
MAKMPSAPRASTPAAEATMKANRRTDTKPELAVRRAIHAAGLRYRVDAPIKLPSGGQVRPDVVFPARRICLFVDGCFWHGCEQHYMAPSANGSYWRAKLELNRARDRRVTDALVADGWKVVRAWEHEDIEAVAARVIAAVREAVP